MCACKRRAGWKIHGPKSSTFSPVQVRVNLTVRVVAKFFHDRISLEMDKSTVNSGNAAAKSFRENIDSWRKVFVYNTCATSSISVIHVFNVSIARIDDAFYGHQGTYIRSDICMYIGYIYIYIYTTTMYFHF